MFSHPQTKHKPVPLSDVGPRRDGDLQHSSSGAQFFPSLFLNLNQQSMGRRWWEQDRVLRFILWMNYQILTVFICCLVSNLLVFRLEHGIKLKSSDLFYEGNPRVYAAGWVEHYASKHSPIADQREKAECLRWMQKYSKLGTFVCLRPVLCKPLLHNLLSDGPDWKEFCCHDINIKTNVCKHLVSTSSWFFHQNILSCLAHALLLDLMDVKGMTSSC